MYNVHDNIYHSALRLPLRIGSKRSVRNGQTIAVFAHQMRFPLRCGFPLITTKEVAFSIIVAELLWFLDAGKETDNRLSICKFNQLLGKDDFAGNIWHNDQSRFEREGKTHFPGDCGRIYGAQWRSWRTADGVTIDQIDKVIKQLRTDPFSRYHIVTAWNPGEIHDMCLPPCHMKMQFFVRPNRRKDKKKYLDLSMDQRSCDLFLGVPFNIASYALLLHMVAQCVDMVPGELIITLEDSHIYTAGKKEGVGLNYSKSHIPAVKKQLQNKSFRAPKLWLNPTITDIDAFTMNDIKIIGYEHRGKIPAPLL
ncbi:MAG: Thymidylate synthase [Candidatus Parcubacteria bacterium]|jgi:thymidylate synthase